jgi:hypothetical protein
MHTADEVRQALEKLAGRLGELTPQERQQYFGDRTVGVTLTDLGVTLATKLGDTAGPIREAAPGEPKADMRLSGDSDTVMQLTEQPINVARAWMQGKVKIEASMKDLFNLRKLL